MIAVVIGVLVTISSLMMAFFLAVSNVSFIVENDFMSKAKQNAVMHALAIGQLENRSQVLGNTTNQKFVDAGSLRKSTGKGYSNVTYNITQENENIEIRVEIR